MIFSVYVIENPKGKIYIGHTESLAARLQRHNGVLPTGSGSYTNKNGGPWSLIHEEKFDTRIEAMKRERELKSSRGREFLKQFRKHRRNIRP